MSERELTDEDKNELWKDDEFCLAKERAELHRESVQVNVDYADQMGRTFFGG